MNSRRFSCMMSFDLFSITSVLNPPAMPIVCIGGFSWVLKHYFGTLLKKFRNRQSENAVLHFYVPPFEVTRFAIGVPHLNLIRRAVIGNPGQNVPMCTDCHYAMLCKCPD